MIPWNAKGEQLGNAMDGQTKHGGRARGRFGVTRDADGSFAIIYAWPWYWRYPFAVCVSGALFAFVMSLAGGRDELAAWIFGGAGAIFILSVAYELFAVLAVLGLLWWVYQAVGDSNGGWRSTVELIAGSFVVVGVYHLLRRSDDTQKALADANARLATVEARLAQMHAEARNQPTRRTGIVSDDL